MKFIGVGDNCMDVYSKTGEAYAGGNSVNFAIYAKQLGEEAAYLGVVGTDKYGDMMMEAIKAKGVDVSHVHRVQGNTAITMVELSDGDRKLGDYDEGVLNKFSLDEKDIEYIKGFDYLHTAFWGKCENYLEVLKDKIEICFDFADKFNLDVIDKIAPNIHYGFLSYDKDDSYIRGYLKKMYELGVKCSIATLGENGSIAYDGDNFYKAGIKKTDVVDTLGAGDAFMTGFMVGISKGLNIDECLELGAVKAAQVITYFGAW